MIERMGKIGKTIPQMDMIWACTSGGRNEFKKKCRISEHAGTLVAGTIPNLDTNLQQARDIRQFLCAGVLNDLVTGLNFPLCVPESLHLKTLKTLFDVIQREVSSSSVITSPVSLDQHSQLRLRSFSSVTRIGWRTDRQTDRETNRQTDRQKRIRSG